MRWREVIEQHQLIVKALLACDADSASAAVLARVDSARRGLLALLPAAA